MSADAEAPKVHVLPSRSTIDIELDEVLADGRLSVFPHVMSSAKLLTLSFLRDKVRLGAGGCIGLIPLAPGVMVDVRPKLPISNLAHVLDVAGSRVDVLPGVERTYREAILSNDSVADFLILNLLASLRVIQDHGWLKDYVQRQEETSYPRGRIDLGRTVIRCLARGMSHKVVNSAFEQTLDVPANRLLRHVLEELLLARRGSVGDASLTAEANAMLLSFPGATGRLRAGDRAVCDAALMRRTLPGVRAYYYRALEIALMLLSGRGVSFDERGDDATLATSIIDFDNVFERYLLKALKARAGNSVSVLDGNAAEGERPLYDGLKKGPPANPDVVLVSAAGGMPVVLDAKYKDRPVREDVNQVVTYGLVYRARRVGLVHQRRPGKDGGLRLLGRIDQVEVWIYAVDLDAPDLKAEEDKMAAALFGLLP